MKKQNVKEVITIDPKTIDLKNKIMTEAERAFMLAKKYKLFDQTLNDIFDKHKNKSLNKSNIEKVNNIVMNIKKQI